MSGWASRERGEEDTGRGLGGWEGESRCDSFSLGSASSGNRGRREVGGPQKKARPEIRK